MIGKKTAIFIFLFALVTILPLAGMSFFTGKGAQTVLAYPVAPITSFAPTVSYKGTEYTPKKNVINILLLGIDSDSERKAENMGARTDMIELCTIDPDANSMTLTGIPRDTAAKMYVLDNVTGQVKSTIIDKVNAAYSCGGGSDKLGPQNAQRCISDLLSVQGAYTVPIQFYISIELGSVPKFASALGGISLPLDMDFPGLGTKGQTVTLDENNAILYLSNRKQVGGDLVRDAHEQQYLLAVMKKIKEQGVVTAAPKLYGALAGFMRTNLSLEQILAVAGILDKVKFENIRMQIIKGNADTIDDIAYYVADVKDMESKVIQLMYTPAGQ